MELIDSFQPTLWTKGTLQDEDYEEKNALGFKHFQIAHKKVVDAKKGVYQYAVYTDEGDLKQVTLTGAGKRDPLNGVGNLEMKLSEDGKQVEGVQLCDECVLFTGASS